MDNLTSNPMCIHGKDTFTRCLDCEAEAMAGRTTGFIAQEHRSSKTLVKRLRAHAEDAYDNGLTGSARTCKEAADEIERLQRLLDVEKRALAAEHETQERFR